MIRGQRVTAMGFFALIGTSLLLSNEPNFSIRNESNTNNNVVYMYAHGLGATQRQGIQLLARVKDNDEAYGVSNHWIMDDPIALFDFCDAKNDHNDYHNKHVVLGQKKDLERLRYAHQKTTELFPNHAIIGVGISRGAVTWINGIPDLNVKALVLESPFDTFKSVVKHILKRYHLYWVPFSKELGMKIAKNHFPTLDTHGIFPYTTITQVPKHIPIILIHSKKDKVIPINSSRKLYVALREVGHNDAYLLELETGTHGKLMIGAHAQHYQDVVHAFYKKYELPHNSEFAQRGENHLALCQPSVGEVLKRIKHQKKCPIEELNEE